jgi:hypothetical protein
MPNRDDVGPTRTGCSASSPEAQERPTRAGVGVRPTRAEAMVPPNPPAVACSIRPPEARVAAIRVPAAAATPREVQLLEPVVATQEERPNPVAPDRRDRPPAGPRRRVHWNPRRGEPRRPWRPVTRPQGVRD